MSGKIRNPAQHCKICGAKCNKRMRYCVACAIQRKAARGGNTMTGINQHTN